MNLALSMDNPVQREAWTILESVSPGKRTNAICEALCGYYKRKGLSEELRAILRDELRNVSISAEEQAPASTPGEIPANALDFIASLQNGGMDGLF